jgi:hypothetical protein
MTAIKHDLGGIIDDLNALQKSRIPYAAKRALFEMGPYMRQFHAREMQGTFRDPAIFTLRSVRYRVEPSELRFTLSISDDGTLGQTPSDYLAPVFRQLGATRGTAVTTRFARQLQRTGQISPGTHLVPNPRARLAETRRGRISSGQYGKILSALGSNIYASAGSNRADRYFAIDSSARSTLKPGIYRAKGDRVSQLFSLLDSAPSVPRRYDWVTASIDEFTDQVEARMARLLAR